MTKEELLAKTQATIDEQQEKLESLKNKALDESQEAIDDVRAAIADLEPKLEQAKAKAKEIAEAADDTWDDMKESLESGWNEASSKLEGQVFKRSGCPLFPVSYWWLIAVAGAAIAAALLM